MRIEKAICRRPPDEADLRDSPADSAESERPDTNRRDFALIAVALMVVALAAYRASLGFSLSDDASYVVIPLRFAQGAVRWSMR